MCGIFAAVSAKGIFSPRDFSQFVDLTDRVSYRGPDASGYAALHAKEGRVDPERNAFDVFLGHRRLSILDLSSAGNQPMSTPDGKVWIVFNGEIFNYVEIRGELLKKGYAFKTKTDTEVILNAYLEYGEEGFHVFNGMWAFVLVDLAKKKIVASRDRFSIKPLYYTFSEGAYYFASEIKQLIPRLRERKVNESVLYAFLKQSLIDHNEETFFHDIFKVKPMHSMVMDMRDGRARDVRYWDYSEEPLPQRDEDVTAAFKDLFVDSVKIRLRSDVPVGCLLSGGLDSSSIAAVSNGLMENGIFCFSVVSSEAKYSEEKYVDIVKNENNIVVEKVHFEPEAAWEKLHETVAHYDEPFGELSAVSHYEMMRLVKEKTGIIVVLSGQGGDEILCGYRKYFFFYLMQELKRKKFAAAAKNVISSLLNKTMLWQFSLSEAKRYMPFGRTALDPLAGVLRIKKELEPVWEVETLNDRQKRDIDKYSVPALTHYEDRNSMAYSLEIRLPFLDHRIVNFAVNLPAELKIRNGWSKFILRKAMDGVLPRAIAWRRDKQGFVTPEEKWLKANFKENIKEIFKSSVLADAGIVHKNKLSDVYEDFLAGNKRIWYADISRLVISELWMRKYFEKN